MTNKIHIISLLFALCSVSTVESQSVTIQTNSTQSILRIDGAATAATKNPSTGSPTAAQAVDDVIINSFGNLGIGVVDATTKIDIKTTTNNAIRIEDGSQKQAQALYSDANGNTSWEVITGAWYGILREAKLDHLAAAIIRPYTNYASGYISNPLVGAYTPTTGTIKVPYKGLYRIIISGNMWARRTSTAMKFFGIFNININNTTMASTNTTGYSYWGSSFSGTAILDLDKDDLVSLAVNETRGNESCSQTDNVTLQVIYIGELWEKYAYPSK